MTPLKEGMVVQTCDGLPALPPEDHPVALKDPVIMQIPVLVIGAGPSGLSAAKLIADHGVKVLLIDDKERTGGKLVLQTHKFFGSQEDVYAGQRGIEIGQILGDQAKQSPNVELWLNSTALAVFSDEKVGVLKENKEYVLIQPERLFVATGAREKMLIFPGDTLPGVYGAGAFQTLVNRDLVRASKRIFIVGGGNVGLIAGYHAIQAGIQVVGLIEALPRCGGYYVHETKLRRLGVPIYTRHTIIAANGTDSVESITIGELDEKWQVIPGTERVYECDTILIAVGLNPVDEFYLKAVQYGMKVWVAGDAQEIAEASAAIFTGRIEAVKLLGSMGITTPHDLAELEEKAAIMKARPPLPERRDVPALEEGVFPVFHCEQEIPCNPCTSVCPNNLIDTIDHKITQYPYLKKEGECIACGRCVAVCPGLAVTLVDYRKDPENPTVTFPYEIATAKLEKGQSVSVLDNDGEIGSFEVSRTRILKEYPKTQLVSVQLPRLVAKRAIGIRNIAVSNIEPMDMYQNPPLPDSAIVCRCERVTAGEIRQWIRKGVTDINQLKAITRAGMGACGGKTCTSLIERLFREENIPPKKITKGVQRPLFVEVPLGVFAGLKEDE